MKPPFSFYFLLFLLRFMRAPVDFLSAADFRPQSLAA
jgi:hypothetical protein